MMKVSMRGGFSDRFGIKPENTEIQLYQFDQRTRIKLQNMIDEMFHMVRKNNSYYEREEGQDFYKFVLGTIYSQPINNSKYYSGNEVFSIINETISKGDYDEILTIIEAIINYWHSNLIETNSSYAYHSSNGESLYDYANQTFKREYIGYRFIEKLISPISDENEIQSLSEAINNKFDIVHDHILKANFFLSDRIQPDYENSIKESICAVEALCVIITGARGNDATLGKMLKKLEDNGVVIHNAMKSAFGSLYGFTNDANGIRHAGDIGGPSSTFEEAKYMLVSCSAFVNYLTALMSD